jgi:hypothetical protein
MSNNTKFYIKRYIKIAKKKENKKSSVFEEKIIVKCFGEK